MKGVGEVLHSLIAVRSWLTGIPKDETRCATQVGVLKKRLSRTGYRHRIPDCARLRWWRSGREQQSGQWSLVGQELLSRVGFWKVLTGGTDTDEADGEDHIKGDVCPWSTRATASHRNPRGENR